MGEFLIKKNGAVRSTCPVYSLDDLLSNILPILSTTHESGGATSAIAS